MRLTIGVAQPLDRHVGVDLSRGERRVAEELLDDPQVGTALEQVRRRTVPQAVWAEVGRALMDELGSVIFAAGRPDDFRKVCIQPHKVTDGN